MTKLTSLEDLWNYFEFNPNEEQRRAILHQGGPLYLPAGPGSGKTRVLLWRTINLIACHGVEPREIFLATFTEKAARQLREGIRALLGAVTNLTGKPYDVEQMYVGTVHSLCQRLIADRRFYPDRLAGRPPSLIDELTQYFQVYQKRRWEALVEGLEIKDDPHLRINTLFGKQSKSRHESVMNCLSLFNRLSEECLKSPDWDGKTFDMANAEVFIDLLTCYQRYLANLAQHPARTDFALLQQEALRVVQAYSGPAIFQHVIVDEYQDTNTIQERLYFALAAQTQNLCVVGDDEQALYRFRGATVENFVQFPERCKSVFAQEPTKIPLSINYRSRKTIVQAYTDFMKWSDWSRDGSKGGRAPGPYAGDFYRVPDKEIRSHSTDDQPAIVATSPASGEALAEELAAFCKKLIDEGVVANPNQIAFLFPSLKSVQVGRIKRALEALDLKVYAPRAGTFLEVEEAEAMFGLYLHIFGRPCPNFEPAEGTDFEKYHRWMDKAWDTAKHLMTADKSLQEFIKDRKADIDRSVKDLDALQKVVETHRWDDTAPYNLSTMKRALAQAPGLSEEARQSITSYYFEQIVLKRIAEGDPFKLRYIITRATSLDWSPLDLFYRLCGFGHFKAMFDLAESATDEGPVCNLGLVSQYLARFMEEYTTLLTAKLLKEDGFQRLFFSSYLYILYRRGESEFEDAEDPFPRGRIPFLTIHQSKGLEFPVVVLGNTAQVDRGPQKVEMLVGPLLQREGEPLDRMSEFDNMRKFYVALSRAKNLLVLAYGKGAGLTPFPPFRTMLSNIPKVSGFDLTHVPKSELDDDDTPRNYSFTADYLVYDRCPRQYMIFRKYGFVPSRSQTMMFGTLVHRTIEDLHQFLIARRENGNTDNGQTEEAHP